MSIAAPPVCAPAENPNPHFLIGVEQVAKRLGISVRTIWRLDAAGKLPEPIRISGSVRWRSVEITAWIEGGCPDRDSWNRHPKNPFRKV